MSKFIQNKLSKEQNESLNILFQNKKNLDYETIKKDLISEVRKYYSDKEYHFRINFEFESFLKRICRKYNFSIKNIKEISLWKDYLNRKTYRTSLNFLNKSEAVEYIKNLLIENWFKDKRPVTSDIVYYYITNICLRFKIKITDLFNEIYWNKRDQKMNEIFQRLLNEYKENKKIYEKTWKLNKVSFKTWDSSSASLYKFKYQDIVDLLRKKIWIIELSKFFNVNLFKEEVSEEVSKEVLEEIFSWYDSYREIPTNLKRFIYKFTKKLNLNLKDFVKSKFPDYKKKKIDISIEKMSNKEILNEIKEIKIKMKELKIKKLEFQIQLLKNEKNS